jgi:phosphatidate phosphatase PAH1
MDVIVINTGFEFSSSTPFYVLFDRLPSNKEILDLYVNGRKTQISMEISKNQFASFIRQENSSTKLSPISQQEEIKLTCNECKRSKDSEEPLIINKIEQEEIKVPIDHSPESKIENAPADKLNFKELISSEMDQSDIFRQRLNSNEIKFLGLVDGVNIVHYILRSNTEQFLAGKIYLWDYRSKIVVTDIDGTLTKSDAVGIAMGYIGQDWTRGGVVYFYNILKSRGYKILYLSSRSIKQLEVTRNYLNKVNQSSQSLPDGPLLLNPNNLWLSLINEVSKKSHIFKLETLKNVLNLFPPGGFPFYVGIGNRTGDAMAYSNLGIPRDLIFIINKKNKEKGDFVSIKNFKDPKLKIDIIFP